MTREEAINICKREQYCASHSACPLEECPWNENCPDDAPFDSEIQEAFQMAIEALKAQRWIPCKERLPEKSDDIVLVTVIEERRIRDIYLMRCDEVESAYIAKWISAWMPLPEPYKEENK